MLAWDSANVIASLSEEPTEGRENIVNVLIVGIGYIKKLTAVID
jgi:hypothetical protein